MSHKKQTTTTYRLKIREDMLTAAFAAFSNRQATMAWGKVYRSYCGSKCDLIVRELRFTRSLPTGDQHSPLFDWILIHAPTGQEHDEVLNRISQSHVRMGQLMVYFEPGNGEQFDQWVGAIIGHEELQPLNTLQLIGPGLPRYRRVTRPTKSHANRQPNKTASGEWSRQIGVLGEQVFQKFRYTEVLFIGCGGLGSLMISSMVRKGLKRATLVDHDDLEIHNRPRTVGNEPQDVGKAKALVLGRYLHRIRPESLLTVITKPVEDASVVDRFRRANMVISCVDNDDCRRYIAQRCAEFLCVNLDLGTMVARAPGQTGNVQAGADDPLIISADLRLLIPGACSACVGGLENSSNTTSAVAQDWQAGGRVGSLPSINLMAVGTAIQMYLSFLAGQINGSFWQRLSWDGEQGLTTSAGRVTGDPRCPICRPQ
jgi:hypothetical protein